jgi:hypothetical protein
MHKWTFIWIREISCGKNDASWPIFVCYAESFSFQWPAIICYYHIDIVHLDICSLFLLLSGAIVFLVRHLNCRDFWENSSNAIKRKQPSSSHCGLSFENCWSCFQRSFCHLGVYCSLRKVNLWFSFNLSQCSFRLFIKSQVSCARPSGNFNFLICRAGNVLQI